MWLGVPQMAFLALMLFTVLAAMWSFILIGPFVGFVVLLASSFTYAILRYVSADDPHRLLQRGKQFQSWMHGRRNFAYWGAHSASPTAYQRRINVED